MPENLALRIAELSARDEFGAIDTEQAPWPGRHQVLAGGDVYIRQTPTTTAAAQPALYVHGLGGASTNFTDTAALLAPLLDGHAIDLPGFGRSGPSAVGRYSIAAHARVVTSYLEQSGRGPVHLIGNSMGGAISIRVAATRPDLVRTLTLISPAVSDLRPKRGQDLLLPLMMLPGVGHRFMRRAVAGRPEDRAKAVVELCFAHPELVPPNRLAEAAADVMSRDGLPWATDAFLGSLRGIAASYLRLGAASVWQIMATITAPTLVLWGELDRLVDVSRAPRVARTISDSTLLVLPDVGHTAQLEDPMTTARAISGLLRRANQGLEA
jgi:pimeloyl-ACP methyl ester carboxylesterase